MKKTEFFFIIISTLIITYSLLNKIETTPYLNIEKIHIEDASQIIDIQDSLVIPVLYDSLVINSFATVNERKKQFINQVLPAILVVRFEMENKNRKVKRTIKKIEKGDSLNIKEQYFVDSLMKKYRARTPENLLIKMRPNPTSLVLAQAAVESGWGSSRFAGEGNNLFGVWTTSNDPHVIKSLYDRDSTAIFVKKYSNIAESIDHYFLTIGRHKAYRNFRLKRSQNVTVFQLIDELDKYSENGKEYTHLLKKMIEWNDFEKYDYYIIDPAYIVRGTAWEKLMKNIKEKFENNE